MTNIFTDNGVKFLVSTFGVGFIIGLISGVIGFTLAVDAMARR